MKNNFKVFSRRFSVVLFLGLFSVLFPLSSMAGFAPAIGRTFSERDSSWMVGAWKFSGYIYHNEFKLPLNPHLILVFQFFADGTNDLAWRRDEEPGFCERKGTFSLDGDFLNEEVTWINPENDVSCSQDPEMVLGRKTNDEIHLVDGKIQLYLSLSGEPFIYVFERTKLPANWPKLPLFEPLN